MHSPFIVRYRGKHHKFIEALVDYLGELIKANKVGQCTRHLQREAGGSNRLNEHVTRDDRESELDSIIRFMC